MLSILNYLFNNNNSNNTSIIPLQQIIIIPNSYTPQYNSSKYYYRDIKLKNDSLPIYYNSSFVIKKITWPPSKSK